MLHSDIIEEYEKIIYEHPPVKMIIFQQVSILRYYQMPWQHPAIKEFLSSSKQKRS